ncbi:hypothetical protein MTO96_031526, partial [Rhipicephalus appendiculatus]
ISWTFGDHRDFGKHFLSRQSKGEYVMKAGLGTSIAVVVATVVAALIMGPEETNALPPFWWLGLGREENEKPAQ